MVSSVNFGNFVTVNGKTVTSGSQSGLDTEGIIKALVSVREAGLTKLTDKQTKVGKQISEFGAYNNLLSKLKSSVNLLRNPPGFAQEANNVFKFRTVNLSTSDGSTASNYVSVTGNPGARLARYNLAINNLAESRQLRSSTSFTSSTNDVTAGGGVTTQDFYTISNPAFTSSSYSKTGSGTGIVAAAGINNFTVGGTSTGDSKLQGTISGFSATVDGTNVDLSVTVNGRVYTANDVAANTGGGTDSIAAGSITFTNSTTGTSFDVVLGSDYVIAGNQTNANNFATALDSGLSGVSVYQSRQLGNFNVSNTLDTVLEDLASSNVTFSGNSFDLTTARQGSFGPFTVNAVSSSGANDGSISVTINGEVFTATGLGNDGSDTETSNLTLTTASGKTLNINLADAGITLDFSSGATATVVQTALNKSFNTLGTFKITSSLHNLQDFKLKTADYSKTGTGTGIVAAAGINNFTVGASATGDSKLQGTISGFSATVDGANVDLSVTVNGVVYTANNVPANTGGGTDSIAAGSITFSNSASGTSFDVVLGSSYVIAGNQTNANTFAAALDSGLSGVSVYQKRELGNFSIGKTSGTVLSGLESADIGFSSNGFDLTTLRQGSLGTFSVSGVSAVGANDASISVVINGETFTASGLGNDGSGTENDNIILTASSGKQFNINLADAGITLDFSSTTSSATIQTALNKVFNAFSEDVTINSGASLTSVAAAINAKSATTKVSASIIQVADNDYRLVLTSDNSGFAGGFDLVNATTVFGSSPFTTVQAEEDAKITLDGLSIYRSSNTISDAVANVTFSLLQETGLATISTTIDKDVDSASSAILSFVAAYNEVKVFLARQAERDATTGVFKETAILGASSLVNTSGQSFSTEINRTLSGLGADVVKRLGDLGITLTDLEEDVATETPLTRNVLTVDQTKLDSKLRSNFSEVQALFEFTEVSSASDIIGITARTNALNVNKFTVNIDTGRTSADRVRITYLDSNSATQTVNATLSGSAGNYKIVGQTGTVLEGIEFIYVGDGTDEIFFDVQQGIGDRLYNLTDSLVAANGLIDREIENLNDSEDDLKTEIDRETTRISEYRDRLLGQYSRFEDQLTKINSALAFLTAQTNARNENSS